MLRKVTIKTSEGDIVLQELSFKKQLELLDAKDITTYDIYKCYFVNESDIAKMDLLNKQDAKLIIETIKMLRGDAQDPKQEAT